ncbi:MAG TPA: hypothetical protein PLV95_01005 [Candidatus Pacearchaeota archaeon]|nr:hypothetical protein [Candidatus Pacearchaeota archaeon]
MSKKKQRVFGLLAFGQYEMAVKVAEKENISDWLVDRSLKIARNLAKKETINELRRFVADMSYALCDDKFVRAVINNCLEDEQYEYAIELAQRYGETRWLSDRCTEIIDNFIREGENQKMRSFVYKIDKIWPQKNFAQLLAEARMKL